MIDESEFLKSLEAARERLENPEPVSKAAAQQSVQENNAAEPKRKAESAPEKAEEKMATAEAKEQTAKADELVINEPESTAAPAEKSNVNTKALSMILGGSAVIISVVLSLVKVFFISSDYIQICSFLVSIATIITGALMMKKAGKGGLCLILGVIALVVTLVLAPLITVLMFGAPA